MKNKLLLIFTALVSLVLLNCSSDDNYIAKTEFKFPFTVETVKDAVYYANEMGTVSLKPTLEVENEKVKLDYYVSITTSNKDDVTIYYEKEPVKQGESNPFKYDRYNFVFKKTGTYDIKFVIENQYGFVLEHKETIEVKEIDFYMSLSYENEIYPKINKFFTLDIAPKNEHEKENNITYKWSYEYVDEQNPIQIIYNSRRLLSKEEVTYNGKDIKILFPKSGEYEILLTGVSSQGKKVIKKEIIIVSEVEFDFNLLNDQKIYPNTKSLFKLKATNITEDILQKYTFKYLITGENQPIVNYNSVVISPNREIVYSGEDLYMTFPKEGQYDIKVILENQFGKVIEKDFAYNVNYANFDIEVKDVPKEIYIDKEYIFNVSPKNLAENNPEVDYTFKVNYDTSKMKITYNDQTLSSGTYVKYTSSKVKVIWASKGATDITFAMKNNQGLEVSKQQNFTAEIATFDLAVKKEEVYKPSRKTPLRFNIVNKSTLTDITYTFNVTSNSPEAKFFYNNVEISKELMHDYRNENLEVMFPKDGSFEVTISVKNSQNHVVSKKTVIVVSPVKFDFTISNEGKIFPSEKTNLGVNITSDEKETQTYDFSYSVKGSAKPSVYINNNLVLENSISSFSKSSNLAITFDKVGVYEVEYKLTNNFGYTVTKTVTYDVNYANFDIEINNSNKEYFINNKYSLDFKAKLEDNRQESFTYKISANPNTKVFYNGVQISLNNYANYNSSKLDFEFSSQGTQEITIFMKNSQGLEVSKKLSFDVKVSTFTLDIEKALKYVPNEKGSLKVTPKSTQQGINYEFTAVYPREVQLYYKGNPIASNMKQKYETSDFDFVASKSGQYQITFAFTNSHGQRVEQKTIVQVEEVKFNYNLTTEDKLYPNKVANFKLIPTFEDKNVEQKLKFKIASKSSNRANFSYNGTTVYENEFVDYNNQNLSVSFPQVGKYDFEVTMQNQYGYEVKRTHTFEVGYNTFEIVTGNLPSELFLNQDFDLSIKPQSQSSLTYQVKIVADNSLNLKYKGYYIPLNNYVDYSDETFNFQFTTSGKKEVTVYLKNSQGLEVSKKLSFDVKVSTFTLDIEKALKYVPNEKGSLKVTPKSTQQGINYEFTAIYPREVQLYYKGNPIASNMKQKYETSDFDFVASKSGQYEITFAFINSHDQRVEQKTIVQVEEVKFNYNLTTEDKLYPNKVANFKLIPTFEDKNVEQKLKFKIASKSNNRANFSYNGTTVYENEFVDYNNQNLSVSFPQVGKYDFEVTMQNQYGYEVKRTHTFEVGYNTFEIVTGNLPSDVYVNDLFYIDVQPKTDQQVNLEYQIKVEGNALQAMYNNYNMPLNTYTSYINGKLGFKFNSEGQKEVTVYLKNNQGLEVSKKLVFIVKTASMTADFEIQDKVYPLQEIPLKVLVNNTAQTTSEFKITTSNNDVVIKNNGTQLALNSWYNYSQSEFTLKFPKADKYTLNWEFKNALGGTFKKSLVVDVIDTSYEVRVEQPNEIFPNITAPFRIAVAETLKGEYSFKYSIEGNGGLVDFKQGNSTIYQNEWNIFIGNDYLLTFPQQGRYILTLDFKNQYGKEVRQRTEIVVQEPKFTAQVVNDNAIIIRNEDFPLRFIVTENPKDQDIKFTIKGDNTINQIKYGGRTVYLGEELTLTDKAITFNFREKGRQNVTFEFTNKYGVKRVSTIGLDVEQKDYKTEIKSRILSTPLNGYNEVFYENPIKIAVDITSLLQAKDLKIKFRNSRLLDVNGIYVPNMSYDLTQLNNNFVFNFDKSVNGDLQNKVAIDVEDIEGNIITHTISVPVNEKAEKPYIGNIKGIIQLGGYYGDAPGRLKNLKLLPISNFEIKTKLGISYTKIKIICNQYPNERDLIFEKENFFNILDKGNGQYELTAPVVERIYPKHGGTFDQKLSFNIEIIVRDRLGQESVRNYSFEQSEIIRL